MKVQCVSQASRPNFVWVDRFETAIWKMQEKNLSAQYNNIYMSSSLFFYNRGCSTHLKLPILATPRRNPIRTHKSLLYFP